MPTRCKSFGTAATVATSVTADAKTQIGADYTLPSGTRKISRLFLSLGTGSKAEFPCGYITLEIDTVNGPFEFPVPVGYISGTSGTEAAWGAICNIVPIDVDIPIPGAGVLKVYATITEAIEVVVGVQFE